MESEIASIKLFDKIIVHLLFRCNFDPFKDTLKVFNDFKNKQKCVWSNVF